jgi:molybdopterin converting factor small subunit
MEIEIELFGQLSEGKKRRQTLNLDHPLEVQGIAALLGLNPEEVGLITINGIQSEMDDSVKPGCRLCFFPHMSGG